MSQKNNGYKLTRAWFDFCDQHPEKVCPTHTALYMYVVDLCNRLGWKEKFGLPSEHARRIIGVKNWKTYSKVFKELVEWGFVHVVTESKNQYTSCIVALVKNTEANENASPKNTKAPDESAYVKNTKASPKHCSGTVVIDKLIKPLLNLNKTNTVNSASPVDEFVDLVNFLTGKKFKATDKVRIQWNARLKDGYTLSDAQVAIENAKIDSFHIENKYKYLTAEFFTRTDKLERWINAKSGVIIPQPSTTPKRSTLQDAKEAGLRYIEFKERQGNQ
jgi:hypothetical protein